MNPVVLGWMARLGVTVTPETPWPVHLPWVPRRELYALCEQLRLDQGVEIGVLRGLNSHAMLEANPRLTLLCVDPWKAYEDYPDYRRQSRLDGFHAQTKATLEPYADRVAIVRDFSEHAVRGVPLRSLDFAYVDGNHYFDPAMLDLIEWSRRVRPGGLMAAHDYFTWPNKPHMQVVEAVDAYRTAHRITQWFTVGGQAHEEHDIPPTAVWFVPEATV
jgi:predicted O-methyltransferase YrrM